MEKTGNRSNYKSDLPIVIHKSIQAKIYDYYTNRKKNYGAYSMGLYCFLYYSVRYQENNRVWATNTFITKGTGISEKLVPRIKNDLEAMGLIEIYHDRNHEGKFGKQYIDVKFVWKPDAIKRLFYQESDETVEYKIAKALLMNNSHPDEEFTVDQIYEFETVVNDNEATIYADTFYFEGDLLVAVGHLHCDMDDGSRYDYTVPTHRVYEVILDLTNSYKFSFNGVLNALKTEI